MTRAWLGEFNFIFNCNVILSEDVYILCFVVVVVGRIGGLTPVALSDYRRVSELINLIRKPYSSNNFLYFTDLL
jgi:hypothetical protein